MGEHTPLRIFLKSRPEDTVVLTSAEAKEIISEKLPHGAIASLQFEIAGQRLFETSGSFY